MNQLDELLTLYAGQSDVQVRRYLLAAMSVRPLTAATPDLVALLECEAVGDEPALRHAARRELGRVLPRQLVREYGFDLEGAGPWTGSGRPGSAPAERLQPAREAAHDSAAVAALEGLWPALRQALSLVRRGNAAVRRAASLALGRAPLAAVADALVARASQRDAPFDDLAALAELGTSAGHDALLAAASTHALARPELASLLAGIPGARALPLLQQLEARTDLHGRANVAVALATDASPEAHALLARIARRRELWVTAHALDALALRPAAGDLPVLRDVATGEPSEYLRALAVRTAGFARSPEHLELARSAARDASPRVRAAALEALVRLRAPDEALVAYARDLVESPVLRAQVTALLVLSRHDADRVSSSVEDLLFSDAPIRRLESAYLVGYSVGPESASVLAEMAARDPDPDVRWQAVQSLARQPAKLAVPRLDALLSSGDARVAGFAARALPLVEPAALAEAAAAIATALEAPRPPLAGSVRVALLRAAGLAARRLQAPLPPVLDRHLSSADHDDLRGALSGLQLMLGEGVNARVERLLQHPDPRVRAHAAVAGFWAGRAAAVHALQALVSTTDEVPALAGLRALTECATLLPHALAAGCLEAWRSRPASDGAALVAAQVDVAPSGTLDEMAGFEPIAEAPRLAGTAARLHAHRGSARSQLAAKEEILREPLPTLPGPTLRRILVLITVLGAATLFGLRRPPPQEPAPPPTALVVDFAKGVPRRVNTGASTGLALRDVIEPGDRMVTGRTHQLSLKSADGVSIWLEPGSELRQTPEGELAEPLGDVTFDLRARDRVRVDAAPFVLTAARARFRVRADPDELGVHVLAGTVTVEAPGAAPRRLATGDRIELRRR